MGNPSADGQLVIPALDDFAQSGRIDRGTQFLEALSSIGHDVSGRAVVDLGAGFGSISLAAAAMGADVTSVDINEDRLKAIRERASHFGLPVVLRRANLLTDLLELQADVCLMVGVVEYAGLWDQREDVSAIQVDVLKNARKTLRPGGTFVLGTKNRIWPKFVARDNHTRQPLVAVLPRNAASALSRRLNGRPYRHWIQSPAGWRQLLREAGFERITTYFPYLGYQFPIEMVERPKVRDALRLRQAARAAAAGRYAIGKAAPAKIALMGFSRNIGVEASQSVVFIARA